MKYFPFKILVLCVLLPPVFYIFSIQSIERYLHGKYLREIENTYLGNTDPLFNGSIGLKEAVAKNIAFFLKSKKLLSWGLNAQLTIMTKRGRMIYPSIFNDEPSPLSSNPMNLAAENYALMNEGVMIEFNLSLEHNTRIANFLLFFYIFLSLFVLSRYYHRGLKKACREEREKEAEIKRLQDLEAKRYESLLDLTTEKQHLTAEYELMQKQYEDIKKKASINENEMIEEIMALEEKINQNLARQKGQQQEIDVLRGKLSDYEREQPKLKAAGAFQKRFKSIYKNLLFHERALAGFIRLDNNLKIKAEEIIQQLNIDSASVPVKRKVFGKKGRETVLEVVFAYKGRLYYRRLTDNRIEILAIGTKNVQTKDLEFLDKL